MFQGHCGAPSLDHTGGEAFENRVRRHPRDEIALEPVLGNIRGGLYGPFSCPDGGQDSSHPRNYPDAITRQCLGSAGSVSTRPVSRPFSHHVRLTGLGPCAINLSLLRTLWLLGTVTVYTNGYLPLMADAPKRVLHD